MNLRRSLLFILMMFMVLPVAGQYVVVGTPETWSDNWSSPEMESMMRTYLKQLFEVTGRVFGVDEYEPTPYPLQGANIKVTCMGDTTAFDGMAADTDGSFWVYMQRRDRLKDTRLRVTVSYLGMGTLDTIFDLPRHVIN